MTPDTAALRADAADAERRGGRFINVRTDTVRALCDAADEVERLRNPAQGDRVTFQHRIERLLRVALGYRAERDASRTAHAALVADLRALCDKHEHGALRWADPLPVPEWIPLVRAVLDRHAPEETT